jgi:hypothetical protein
LCLKARKIDKHNTKSIDKALIHRIRNTTKQYKNSLRKDFKIGANFANDWSDGSLSPIALGVCQGLTYDYWVKKPVNSNGPMV